MAPRLRHAVALVAAIVAPLAAVRPLELPPVRHHSGRSESRLPELSAAEELSELSETLEEADGDPKKASKKTKGESIPSSFVYLGYIVAILAVGAIALRVAIGPSGAIEVDEEGDNEALATAEGEEEVDRADEDKPVDEVINQDPRMKVLRLKQNKFLMEQAIQKNKREKIMQEIVALQAEIRDEHMSQQDVKAQATRAMDGTEMLSQQSLLTLVAYTAPFVRQAATVKNVVDDFADRTRDNIAKAAAEEAGNLASSISSQLHVAGLENHRFLMSFDLPKASALIAAAVAPLQLKSIYVNNLISMALMSLFIICDLCVVISDLGANCHSGGGTHENGYVHVRQLLGGQLDPTSMKVLHNTDVWVDKVAFDYAYGWSAIDFLVGASIMIVRVRVHLELKAVIEQLDGTPKVNIVKDPMEGFRVMVDHFTSTGGKALVELGHLSGSNLFAMVDCHVFFSFFWMLYACHLSMNLPWAHCETIGLVYLRSRTIIFYICFLPWVLAMVVCIVALFLNRQGVALKILQVADSLDDNLAIGVPFFKVAASVLLLRSTRGEAEVQVTVKKATLATLERKASEAAAAAAAAEAQRLAAEAELSSAESRLEAMGGVSVKKQFDDIKQSIIDDSESFLREIDARATALAKENGADSLSQDLKQAVDEGQLGVFLQKNIQEALKDVAPAGAMQQAALAAEQAQAAAAQAADAAAAQASSSGLQEAAAQAVPNDLMAEAQERANQAAEAAEQAKATAVASTGETSETRQ